jgi:hypothetical protein
VPAADAIPPASVTYLFGKRDAARFGTQTYTVVPDAAIMTDVVGAVAGAQLVGWRAA